MEPNAILNRLSELGINITTVIRPDGIKVLLEPGSAVPRELVEEVKAHKPELVRILKLKGYHLKYSESEAIDTELEEIKARVDVEGYVLLWATVLQDLIAFYRGEADRAGIPPGFVPYSLRELTELFGQNRKTSQHELKLIHEAKKQGARVIGHEPEQSNVSFEASE